MATPLIDPANLERLRALPIDIVVPGDLPEGFAVQAVEAEDDPTWGASYQIRYAGPAGTLVIVEGITSGVGDPMDGETRHTFFNAHLGSGVLEFYSPDSGEPVDFRSHWLQARPEGPVYGVTGRRLDPVQAIQVAEGLQVLV